MAREDDVFNIGTQQVTVGLSSFVGVTGGVGTVSLTLQLLSGGSCLIMGSSAIGASLATLTYAGASWTVTGWLLDTNPITFGGPVSFYIGATGATSILQIMRSKSVGT